MRADRLWLLAVILAAGCTPERVPVTSDVAIPDDDEPALTSTARQPEPEPAPAPEPEPEPAAAPEPAAEPAPEPAAEPPWPPPMPAIDNIRDPEAAEAQRGNTTIIIVPVPSAPRPSVPAGGVGAVLGDSVVVDPTPAPTSDRAPGTQIDPGVPPVPGAPRNSALPPASRSMPGVPPPGTRR